MLNLLAQTTYYYTTTDTTNAAGTGVAAGMLIFIWLLALALVVIHIVALWKIFEKAGEAGWKAIIPFYNIWVLLEVSGKPGWWMLLSFIPFVGSIVFFVLFILAMLELAKRFGKSTLFAVVGLVLFSFIGELILAFGPAQYSGKVFRTFEDKPEVA